jgi:hypothetical protein
MSWEAYRWTAKTPSELLHTLGPHGVDHLVRQYLDAVWRELPDEQRNLDGARRAAQEVFDRNMKVWAAIKKPSPAAFFENLLPKDTDQFLRQAMLVCWMMIPRAGGRDLGDVRKIVTRVYDRNLDAWAEDNEAFTTGGKKKQPGAKKAAPSPKKAAAKPGKAPVKKKTAARAKSKK